jgi:hypothetical protein
MYVENGIAVRFSGSFAAVAGIAKKKKRIRRNGINFLIMAHPSLCSYSL